MKKHIYKLVSLLAIIMAISFSASAQVYVRVRPVMPVIVRPAAPSPRHVWIDEEWTPRGGAYVYSGGRWEAPPRPGMVWVPGHWRHHRRFGEIWVAGHWRR